MRIVCWPGLGNHPLNRSTDATKVQQKMQLAQVFSSRGAIPHFAHVKAASRPAGKRRRSTGTATDGCAKNAKMRAGAEYS
jgi:hypothetical protein